MPWPLIGTFNFLDSKIFEREIRYYIIPNEQEEQLKNDMEELMKNKERIETDASVQMQWQPNKRCKGKVTSWMREVDKLEKKVTELLESQPNVSCPMRFLACGDSLRRGRKISQMARQVAKLNQEQTDFGTELVEEASPERSERIASTASQVVGMEKELDETLAYLQNPSVSVIGIYGGGGIGKTTLMTKLNNKLREQAELDFDFIIWVNVFQSADTDKIQKQISRRLWPTMSDKLPNDLDERANFLYKFFTCGKRFLFLMDDVWNKLNLREIGIPIPNDKNNIKIIFTTRSEQVCHDMSAQQKVKAEHLNLEVSMQLFRMNLEDNAKSEPHVVTYAEKIVKKCGGLPLALIIMAKAVGSCKSGRDWENAMSRLSECPNKFEGMEDELLPVLKFSFDKLDRGIQLCLLHCALYPEDEDIFEEDIIYHWIGEGLLDDAKWCGDNINKLREEGVHRMLKLKRASLLENSILGDFYFKMHHSVRSMCLWISDGQADGGGVFEIRTVTNDDSGSSMEIERWEKATKVSWMQSEIQCFTVDKAPHCDKLVTLLLSDCHRLEKIQHGFFEFMPALRVLDLSDTKLEEVPRCISSLVELRYLDLRNTAIDSLPEELGCLTKLMQLHLSTATRLKNIPKKAVSHLKNLKHLCTEKTPYKWGQTEDKNSLQLADFKDFKRLSELGVDITSDKVFLDLISNMEICKMIKYIVLQGSDFGTAHAILAYVRLPNVSDFKINGSTSMEELTLNGRHHLVYLEKLHLENNIKLRAVTLEMDDDTPETSNASQHNPRPRIPFSRLRRITVESCHLIKDLCFVTQIPFLEELSVSDCNGLEEIVPNYGQEIENNQDKLFQGLQILHLRNLQNLRSIYKFPLIFPRLRTTKVHLCPNLHRLPFGKDSAKSIKVIAANQEWWDALEWDNDNIRSFLLPHFQPDLNLLKHDTETDDHAHGRGIASKHGRKHD